MPHVADPRRIDSPADPHRLAGRPAPSRQSLSCAGAKTSKIWRLGNREEVGDAARAAVVGAEGAVSAGCGQGRGSASAVKRLWRALRSSRHNAPAIPMNKNSTVAKIGKLNESKVKQVKNPATNAPNSA